MHSQSKGILEKKLFTVYIIKAVVNPFKHVNKSCNQTDVDIVVRQKAKALICVAYGNYILDKIRDVFLDIEEGKLLSFTTTKNVRKCLKKRN